MEAEDLLKYMLDFFGNIDIKMKKLGKEHSQIEAEQQGIVLHYRD